MGYFLAFWVFPFLVVIAGVGDFLTLRIPNSLNLLLFFLFFLLAFLCHLPFYDLLWHLFCFSLILIVGFLSYAFGFLGGGDAKMLAVIALWAGPQVLFSFLLITVLCGGVLAFAILYLRAETFSYLPILPRWMAQYCRPKLELPYGIAIACGALGAFPYPFLSPVLY